MNGITLALSDKNTVDVKRRRQGAGGQGPTSGERAGAPSRRQTGGGGGGSFGGGGSSGGSFGSGSGGSSGGMIPGGGKMPVWLIVVLIIGFVIYTLVTSGDSENSGSGDQANEPNAGEVVSSGPSATPRPTSTRPPAGANAGKQTWTVMLYSDADDKILEEDIFTDLNEAERVGSTDRVQIVAQMDRFKGAFKGDDNWTSTRRYFIRQDDDLNRLNSDLVEDLGEVNMADGDTLKEFIQWSAENYPADKYVLILSDHGMGWPGGWSDATETSSDSSRAPLTDQIADNLYLMEMDEILAEARQAAGIDRFEVIGMDACLMGSLEVFTMLQEHARFAIASEETEPSLGWAYTSFLGSLASNPEMDGGALGQSVVESYIQEDLRVVDEEARADFLRQGGMFGSSDVSSEALARELGRDITLTAVDLDALSALNSSVNALAYSLQNVDQSNVAAARDHAQSFTNIFAEEGRSPYIDLGSFIQVLKREESDAGMVGAADQVLADLQNAVIAEKHGSNKKGATGIAIYFPNSTLYRSPMSGPQSYTVIANSFAEVSLWDNFLAFHYNDISFQPDTRSAAIPQAAEPARVPGQGQITISEVSASDDSAAPNQPVTLTAEIEGQNIGYIYLLVGYYDEAANAIFLSDNDYLESAESREVNGLYYPVWQEDGSFTLRLEWEPTVFEISDGETQAVALMNPERYGVSAEEAVYTVDGTYTYQSENSSVRARLYFQGSTLQHVFGFTDGDVSSAREITPQEGDTFTLQEKWLDLDSNGRVTGVSYQEGATLTFNGQPFTWKESYAAEGPYVVGFIVEDLDGNRQQAYTQITVR